MPAAVLVPIIAAAATGTASVVAAKMQSGATGKAADVQQSYNDKALAAAEEQQRYDRQRQSVLDAQALDQRTYQRSQLADYTSRLSPYIDTGNQATSQAQAFLASSPYAARFNAGGGTTTPMPPLGRTVNDTPVSGPATSTMMPADPPPSQAGIREPAPVYVTLRAPSQAPGVPGKIGQVPQSQVAHFLALGATRV